MDDCFCKVQLGVSIFNFYFDQEQLTQKKAGPRIGYCKYWPLFYYTQKQKSCLTLHSPHRRIQNPVKHLKWSFFAKIVNGWKPLNIFEKKLHPRCLTGLSEYPSAPLHHFCISTESILLRDTINIKCCPNSLTLT